ncbi:enolase C-terminal domain-like protein [Dechloromonas sp.]|uniref:enolase C-terminal domain-like protein n=1 Tax=Dechloromonas sp. TaxID=1917218 RepID=UPI00121A1B97|nr:enolase C-terminal domain-like protein [Dechloromonas sp.]MBU3695769.1 o-succinylbenzoate synthase [Dechloromonas sp.]TEX48150.1 MAG: o-succinylbenzoate synthase [Rhodocyclaceae bacterium]
MLTENWQPYTLQFTAPWQTRRGSMAPCSGRLLQLSDAQGQSGWGDSAPLPEFGISPELADAYARDCAELDLAARVAGLPLNALLSDRPAVDAVAVNANHGRLIDWQPSQLAEAYAAGFRIVKFKLGCAPLAAEMSALSACCAALPSGMQLRLDANGAWSISEALELISASSGMPIDMLEEPLRAPDYESLAQLQSEASFPLALDESVHLLTPAYFSAPPVRRLILKPARFGGLRSTWKIGQNAQAAGIECVVTSALESACGLLSSAHLAAALAPSAVHGLAVDHWLTGSPWPWPRIGDGRLQLSRHPGLGFSPD